MTSGSSIGRRPMGFFGPFNKWWSKFFLDHGRRPSKTDIEAWRADNISWRPELTVEDIVQHSKGRRDPEKNRQYFVEYRRKMKAAAKKPARRTSRRRRSGGAAAARDAELDEEEEELAEGAEEEEDDEEVQGPGLAAGGAAAQLEAEAPIAQLHVREPAATAACGAVQSRHAHGGGAALPALPPRPPKEMAVAVDVVPGCAVQPAAVLRAPASRDKCSSTVAGASCSSATSGSDSDSILPNGPAAAVISAAAAAAAAAATADATDSATAGGGCCPHGAMQLEPRSAQLSCHASPLHGGGGGDMLTDAGAAAAAALPSHLAAVAASRAASSALPAVHLPDLMLSGPAAAATNGAVPPGSLASTGAHLLTGGAGVVTQIAVRRTRGPSTSALKRRGSAAALCGGGGANGGCLSHQGSINAATAAGMAAATVAVAAPCAAPLPQEPLLGMLGPADFGGAWGCGGLGPSSWAAEWESQSSWPAEADAMPVTLTGCEAAVAPAGAGAATGVSLGCSSGSSAVDVGRMGSSAASAELAEPAPAPILPPLSPAAASAAAAAAAAAAAKQPANTLPQDATRLMRGIKRPLNLAYAPSATSLTALAECQGGPEEPLAKQQHHTLTLQMPRPGQHQHPQHQPQPQQQLSGVLLSPDICGEGSSTSNGSASVPHCRILLPELHMMQLSPGPCEPAPALAASGHACNGMMLAQQAQVGLQAGSRLPPLPPCGSAGSELQRGVSPTLPVEPAPCPMPTVFMHYRGGAATSQMQQQEQHGCGPVPSLWQCEEAEEQALHRSGAPAPFSFGAAPATAAEAAARAADEEAGVDALGWLDSLLVDPEAFDIIASASPRAAAAPGPLQRGCFGSPLPSRQPQPLEQQEQVQQQGHGTGGTVVSSSCGVDDGVLCGGGLISVNSHGGSGRGLFILV